ncbi:DegV family protein [Rossellomorea vietnamensis]|uniref:DegV family protein n=1 Tax=Rossellomorea aquimaris TaxID=189382 RepID=A0A5D4TXD9_9BACI|nr:DegV family protein [Rossellomorea aquimaris]TYS79366.1 DegV family protein [Rossellomorea aquimaris]
MMKIAWVTDSTACRTEKLDELNNVFVVPMNILIGGKEYKDGVDLFPQELFHLLKENGTDAKTSQPSIGVFKELYSKLQEEYDHIFSIHVSAAFSGTISSARQAAQLVDIPVTVIDSKILSYPLTKLIEEGIDAWKKSKSPSEIKKLLLSKIDSGETYVMVGSLEQLHKSGRMNGVSFFLGSVLKIKPILAIKDGKLEVEEKVRSTVKGYSRMKDYLNEVLLHKKIKEVYILYGSNKEEAESWITGLSAKYPDIDFSSHELGAVIGVHAGENTLGISWFAQ